MEVNFIRVDECDRGLLMKVLDELKAVRDEVVGLRDRVTAHVADLKDQIADLAEKVAAGDATAEEQQLLDEIHATTKAVDPSDPTTLPPTPDDGGPSLPGDMTSDDENA